MKVTHPRVTTNGHIRRQIRDSNESIRELTKRFKWLFYLQKRPNKF